MKQNYVNMMQDFPKCVSWNLTQCHTMITAYGGWGEMISLSNKVRKHRLCKVKQIFSFFIFLLCSSLSLSPFLISVFCFPSFLALSLISIRRLEHWETPGGWRGEKGLGGETQLCTAPLSFQAGSGEGWLE